MNIMLIGKPGAGKGTLSEKLVDLGFMQLSTGNLLRAEEKQDTEEGRALKALLAAGKFASDQTVNKLVDDFVSKNNNILFDGYPRNVAQAELASPMIDKVIFIDTPDHVIYERLANRWVHSSGRVYHTVTKKPKVEGLDDVTGEKLTQRNDDKPEVVLDRLKTFQEVTYPVFTMYQQSKDVLVLDGTSPIPDQVEKVKEFVGLKNKKSLKV